MKYSSQNGFTHVAIAAAVVVLAAIGGVGYFVFTKNDSNGTQNGSSSTASDLSTSSRTADEEAVKATAKEHFALIYQKKIEEAYKVTCQEFQDLTAYSKFQTNVSTRGFQTIDLSAVEYTSVDIRNNQAKISGLVGPLDPNSTLYVNLLKKSNQWCIYGYEIQ
ncbi:hypothetical protein HYW36_03150 [Candidatus Saccharibacteria bacterium]|nr:hypothetical protein [Candidatus Saccharibacteria bacterium]